MNRDGYTLAEALVALAIVGLAVGGLVAGVDQLGRLQGKAVSEVVQAQVRDRLDTSLGRLLEAAGPFRSDDAEGLTGGADHFSFACGNKICSGELIRKANTTNLVLKNKNGQSSTIPIDAFGTMSFDYDDEVGEETSWPPPDRRKPRTLRAISMVNPHLGEDIPFATARVFAEHPAACAFDAISRTCRPEAAR